MALFIARFNSPQFIHIKIAVDSKNEPNNKTGRG